MSKLIPVLSAAQRALEICFGGPLRFGPMVAFAVALSPISVLGLNATIWALIAGMIASCAAERESMLQVLKPVSPPTEPRAKAEGPPLAPAREAGSPARP